MPVNILKKIALLVIIISQCNNCLAFNEGQVYTDKKTALLGEKVTLTYVFNYIKTPNAIPFPKKEDFKNLTVIEIKETVIKVNQVTKQYIFTAFDSGQVLIPFTNNGDFEINNLPIITFEYLPTALIPDTMLPRYPALMASSKNINKNNLEKYLVLILSGIALSILGYFIYLKFKRKKTTQIQNNNIFDALKKLKTGQTQQQTTAMYNDLRKIIIASLQNKTNTLLEHNTQNELELYINQQAAIANKKELLEIIAISNPTLYGKYFPDESIQKKHITIIKDFVAKNNFNDL